MVQWFMLAMDVVDALVVDMDECPLHLGKTFQFPLQALADIVRVAQGGLGIHDDVDLDVKMLSGMVGSTLEK